MVLVVGLAFWNVFFVLDKSFRDIFLPEDDITGNFLFALVMSCTFMPFAPATAAAGKCYRGFLSLKEGDVSMKLKLLFLSVVFTMGMFSKELTAEAKKWYDAPTEGPSEHIT